MTATPLRVDLRARSPVTTALAAVLVVAWVAQAAWAGRHGWSDAWTGPRPEALRTALGGQVRDLVLHGQVWRLVTGGLVHADLGHLLGNVVAIGLLGRVLEPLVGGRRVAGLVLLGIVAGSALAVATGVARSDGASGGAFALLGAGIAVGRRWPLGPRDRSLLATGFLAVAIVNVLLSLLIPALDAAAHVGGLVAGWALGSRLAPLAERAALPAPR